MPNKHKNQLLGFNPDDPALRDRVEALAGRLGATRKQVMEAAITEYLDRVTESETAMNGSTITLISACAGDLVPGTDLGDPDCPQIPGLLERGDVRAFFAEQGFGPGEQDQLMYLVTDGTPAPDGFPSLTVAIEPAVSDISDITFAMMSDAGIEAELVERQRTPDGGAEYTLVRGDMKIAFGPSVTERVSPAPGWDITTYERATDDDGAYWSQTSQDHAGTPAEVLRLIAAAVAS